MGRGFWEVVNVKKRDTGCSSFEERKAKAIVVSWLLRVVFGEHLMSDLGRACLLEIGCNARWWAWCRHIWNKHD